MKDAPRSRPAALAQYRRRAAIYDLELAPFEPIRRDAVARLGLAPGDTVLDAGCGTGLSLPLLCASVGPAGRVVGIEQCPEMLARARRRVGEPGCGNAELIASPVETAAIAATADAALFHFTHDILRDPVAVANVFASLRPGAHVVAAGLQWTAPWLWPLNLFVLGAALHSVSSLAGLSDPWRLLVARLDRLQVDHVWGGAVYLASGTVRPTRGPRARRPRAAGP